MNRKRLCTAARLCAELAALCIARERGQNSVRLVQSIYNASTLGGQYGVVGGVAYAAWYTSFPNVAIVIYLLRTRRGIKSLPVAINERYGSLATLSFGLVRTGALALLCVS